MLLRRIIDLVKSQSWVAIMLDFVIVVVGVLFALMTEQWLQEKEQQDELMSAEIAINADILQNLFNVNEVLALSTCRQQRTQVLSNLLEAEAAQWDGLPWAPHQGAFGTLLPEVLPTPFRLWGSRLWDAEQRNGTFTKMNVDRRRSLDRLFSSANMMLEKQNQLIEAQSRLQILAIAKKITPSERTKYLELLHYHDQHSGMQELSAKQILAQIEAIGYKPDQTYIQEFGEYMATYSDARKERYSDCFVPFEMPYL